MGILSYRCIATGESFLGASTDIHADINSLNMKLTSGYHPNRQLLSLWKEYGKDGFEISVIEELEYKDGEEDYKEKLEALREEYLEKDPTSKKIWK